MEYRLLKEEEITRELFHHFIRTQNVTDCWRKKDGKWCIEADPFIDDWNEEEYEFLVKCLKNTVRTDGIVYGAFNNNKLKAFVSVERELLGSRQQYSDLTSIHVSQDMRGTGIGKQLFHMAAEWAKQHGAKKLYISAHSAVESQAFYRSLGCIEAEEPNKEHIECEPYDVQMEYSL